MSASQVEIVQAAREMADRLEAAAPPVSRNTFLTLVSPHLAGRSRQELVKTLELLEKGSGGHLKRDGTFGDQVKAAVPILQEDLAATELDTAEYRSFLGWVARLLGVKKGVGTPSPGKERVGGAGPGGRPGDSGGTSPGPDRRGRVRGRLGTFNRASLSELEALKRRLDTEGEDER